MSHDHNHSHGTEDIKDGVLLWTIIANLGLSVFEFLAGIFSGSVALMSDALHNTNDAFALLVAYIARKVARKGADHRFTFGYRRAELIGAMIQLTALIVVGLYLLFEAVTRYFEPEPLKGGWIMGAAFIALVVDIVTAWLLWAMSKGSLNLRAAFFHNLTDAAASIAVLLGGAAIFWLDWFWVDPTLSILIAGYILYMSFGMLKKTIAILMQGTPADISLDELKKAVETIDGVRDLHHLHVWEMDEKHRALEAHVVVDGTMDLAASITVRLQIRELLRERFAIAHSTLEIESPENGCAPEDVKLVPEH